MTKYDAGSSNGVLADLYANESNGFNYTQVGFIKLKAAPSDKSTKYGYIVAKPELV